MSSTSTRNPTTAAAGPKSRPFTLAARPSLIGSAQGWHCRREYLLPVWSLI
ncbi:hypothetical protein [Psychromicrobium xiongbiense]|uniref:hypothetical protein n=1 Tax=Psychromicrobium xiongbiense TaxID=3051184 RepID=UPI00255261C3|nr:hypothetical protein [Psychromicrobium sp. YIM S02556]